MVQTHFSCYTSYNASFVFLSTTPSICLLWDKGYFFVSTCHDLECMSAYQFRLPFHVNAFPEIPFSFIFLPAAIGFISAMGLTGSVPCWPTHLHCSSWPDSLCIGDHPFIHFTSLSMSSLAISLVLSSLQVQDKA